MRESWSRWRAVVWPALLFAVILVPRMAAGQQSTIATPYHSVGDRFFENIGIGWGLRSKGIALQFGGPTLAAPQFGGFQPGAGANLGFGFGRGGTAGFVNANFSQGSQRSLVTQTPVITVTDGVPGYVAVGTVRPFVVSYVPVVGGFPTIPAVFLPEPPMPVMPPASSGVGADAVRDALRRAGERIDAESGGRGAARGLTPPVVPEPGPEQLPPPADSARPAESLLRRLAAAGESSAGRVAPSVAEAKRLRAAEESALQAEAQIAYERGLAAQEAGNLGAAKVYFRMAARHAGEELRRQIRQRLETLDASTPSGIDGKAVRPSRGFDARAGHPYYGPDSRGARRPRESPGTEGRAARSNARP